VTYRPPPLREALALAYLDGLQRKAAEAAQERAGRTIRLDTPGRAPVVPLRPTGGDRG
jgi:hypothetical protein